MDPHSNPVHQNSTAPKGQSVEVAAGLIFRGTRLLIAQRRPNAHLGGLWEFPGGKREAEETFEAALIRELREELGVSVSVGELIETVDHAYPDKVVRICFFLCRLEEGEPQALDCHNIKWIDRTELSRQAFPAADAHLLKRLCAEDRFWSDGSAAA